MACPHGLAKKKCKPCKRAYDNEWYKNNSARRNKRVSKNVSLHRAKLKAEIDKIKDAPCMDCGIPYPPPVMEFDHRDRTSKVDCVAKLINRGFTLEKILDEIKKCDLVCANCHRLRTWKHSGAVAQWQSARSISERS